MLLVTLSHRVLPMLPSTRPYSRVLVEGITLSTAPTTRSEALEPVVLEVDEPEPVFVVELAAVLMRLVTSSSTP